MELLGLQPAIIFLGHDDNKGRVVCVSNNVDWIQILLSTYHTIISLPMNNFTPDETGPSARTLMLIRQIAYTYRVSKLTGRPLNFCVN